MNIFPHRGRVRLMVVACGLMLLSACATTVSTEIQIERRATERWDVLLAGDLASAYEFLSPGYRSSVSSLQYQRSILIQKVRWTGAEYTESECEETACTVHISLGYAIYGALPGVKSFDGTKVVDESWVLDHGQWYFVPPQ